MWEEPFTERDIFNADVNDLLHDLNGACLIPLLPFDTLSAAAIKQLKNLSFLEEKNELVFLISQIVLDLRKEPRCFDKVLRRVKKPSQQIINKEF